MANNPTGIQLPDFTDDPTQREFQFENLKTSRTAGTIASGAEALHESFLGQGFGLAINEAADKFIPGKFLSPDQWKTSDLYRPGLNFPEGVSENVAYLKAQDFDAQQERRATIDAMPDGALSWTAKQVGNIAGFTAGTPFVGVAAGALGRASTPIVAGLAEKGTAAALAASATEGAIIGAGITVPQEGMHLLNASLYGDDYSGLEAITNIGANAGLGGLLHMGGTAIMKGLDKKPFQTITTDADRTAKESAVSQVAEGKSVDVEPIIKQGFADARAREEVSPDVQREELIKSLNKIDEQIKAKEAEYDDLPELDDDHYYHGSPEIVNEIKNEGLFEGLFLSRNRDAALSHGDFLHTVKLEEDDILTQQDITWNLDYETVKSQLHDILKLSKEHEKYFDEIYNHIIEEKSFFDSDIPEDELLSIFKSAGDLGEASWEGQRIKGEIAKRNGYKAVEMTDEHGTSYLALPGAEIFPTRSAILQSEIDQLKKVQRNHQAAIDALAKPAEPVTQPELKAHAAKMDSIDSDSAIDTQAIKAIEAEADSLPESINELLSALEDQIKELAADEKLTPEEKAVIEDVNQYAGRAEKLKKVIRSAIDCLVTK